VDELPQQQQGKALKLMRAAWKAKTAEEAEKRLEQLARFLERNYESAAPSHWEKLPEMFTVQCLQLPDRLRKFVATPNPIDTPQGGVECRTHKVTRSRDTGMVECWVAAAWLLSRRSVRREPPRAHDMMGSLVVRVLGP